MKKAADKTTKAVSGKDPFSLSTLASDFLDTTWRISVPVVVFAAGGIFMDMQLGTKPWLTLLGTVIGFVAAGLLLKRQLDAAQQEDDK